ncbi:MAG: DNA repair protein RadA [Chloroflexi bacterium RBG_13_54_9]|nr:MAG: DNA repair protein RadA [Chloroflexi bacterium RBG_13_54_9]
MATPSGKTIFVCQQCGHESPKWLGRCPNCREWNTYLETKTSPPTRPSRTSPPSTTQPVELSKVTTEDVTRLALPLTEFNRLLGGGIVPGSLILIGGEPGVGKSTFLLQLAAIMATEQGRALYVSGEESVQQLKLRADRLGLKGRELYLLAETELDGIIERMEELAPKLAIIDSIQTIYLDEMGSEPGSIGQVRQCTLRLMRWAKSTNTPVFIVGHLTKDGAIAGPRLLEHIVDVVLYMEGERFSAYRLIRSAKNRFGPTHEVGVFEMRDAGLIEVSNPSQAFLAERQENAIGSAIVPTLEGTRPLLIEIQALTSATSFGLPRRTTNGVDFNRLLLITAVLSKRAGLALSNQDIIVNVVGGLKVAEPAADLGIALAIASSLRDRSVNPDMVAIGEIGLSGELRGVAQIERRLAEAAKLGFGSCLVPHSSKQQWGSNQSRENLSIQLIGARSLTEAIGIALT